MKKQRAASASMITQRRDSWIRKLGELGPFTRGSLVTARRGNHIAHQLTVSVKGKTHTVYVPKDMVPEVRGWIRNYRRLQKIIKEISKLDMALIHLHIPVSRDAARKSVNSRKSL